ncbi:hypothetical protein AB205_0091080 [Aquarana catesbeiana]|uniref:Uncharacterized protein n=1 Tax=Aquarana catesbeiana TaxID=8400 RepID=A0A2G9S5N8_AQUCT|nr:hypothetical protein AB205_0091080 [Aquarana catesbeiana]
MRRRRRYWIHPIIVNRDTRGQFWAMFQNLRGYDDKFFNYTRMSIASQKTAAARTLSAGRPSSVPSVPRISAIYQCHVLVPSVISATCHQCHVSSVAPVISATY